MDKYGNEFNYDFLERNNLSYFSLPYNTKKPEKGKSWNPNKKEQTKPTSKNNLAIKMGIDGIFCIDADTKDRFEIVNEIYQKFPTYREETPRGIHLVYRAPFNVAKKPKQNGIDILGVGSYIVSKGSVVDGIEYTGNEEDITNLFYEEIDEIRKMASLIIEPALYDKVPHKCHQLLNSTELDGYESASEKDQAILSHLLIGEITSNNKIIEIVKNSKWWVNSHFRKVSDINNYVEYGKKSFYKSLEKNSILKQNILHAFDNFKDRKTRENRTYKTILDTILKTMVVNGNVKYNEGFESVIFGISYGQISKFSGASKPTVKKYMRKLLEDKVLEIEEKATNKKSTVYKISAKTLDNLSLTLEDKHYKPITQYTHSAELYNRFNSTFARSFKVLYDYMGNEEKTFKQLTSVLASSSLKYLIKKAKKLELLTYKNGKYKLTTTKLKEILIKLNLEKKSLILAIKYEIKRFQRINFKRVVYYSNRLIKERLSFALYSRAKNVSRGEKRNLDYLIERELIKLRFLII